MERPMNTYNIHETRLPKSISALTVENVRAEVARIAALRSAIADHATPQGYEFDTATPDDAVRNLHVAVLKAAALHHPYAHSLAFAVIENEI
jgi:hypothetical protein